MPHVPLAGRKSSRHVAILALAVGLGAACSFAYQLDAEPHFVDESAYIATSYFADLWLDGRRDDVAWFDFQAIDYPPLSRYLIGGSLRAAGYPRPSPSQGAAWYRNTHARFETPEMLRVARWPSVTLGSVGCVAVFALGTLAAGRRVGVLAAILLAMDPLYRMHARRAMADVPCEAFLLAAVALGLWSWRKTLAGRIGFLEGLAAVIGTGLFAGLAVLAKLTGGLAPLILVGWAALAACLPGLSAWRKGVVAIGSALACLVAFATFTGLYPSLTAHPRKSLQSRLQTFEAQDLRGRLHLLYNHRRDMADGQRAIFAHNALWKGSDKLKVAVVQGFGRFGPFGPGHSDSRIRFDRTQDWGALLWAPLVVLGVGCAIARGRSQWRAGEPPTCWAVLTQAVIAFATVAVYIPLAWDRYLLPIQSGAALLGAIAAVGMLDGLIALRARMR